jgi:hypothetical protein
MVVTRNFPMSGQTGAIGAIFNFGGSTMFSQLFDGSPQFYPGSLVQVEEIITIFTSIVQEHLVDTDLNWWQPKKYIGSYQILSEIGEPLHYEGDDGYIVDTIQNIRRYSWYTITANPLVPVGQGENVSIQDCSFTSVPGILIDPITDTLVVGAQKLYDYGDDAALFRGYQTIRPAPLADTKFFRKIGGVGLYLQPGVEGIGIDYTARIVNDIYTAYSPEPPYACYIVTPPCNQQFDAYLQSFVNSPADNRPYRTLGECEAANGVGSCWDGLPFVCESDPTQIFPTWTSQNQ